MVQVESHPYLPELDLLESQRLSKTPAQVVLTWAVQRGRALLTTSVTPSRIQENFGLSTIPEDAMRVVRGITTSLRSNAVVETGVPGFIPRAG